MHTFVCPAPRELHYTFERYNDDGVVFTLLPTCKSPISTLVTTSSVENPECSLYSLHHKRRKPIYCNSICPSKGGPFIVCIVSASKKIIF